ncbi:hypothetical protein [Persephonella sp.]|uniref:hypothetical protein n=1 Tax=Persephonella sp. TaxID=2060922 RepID=UPI00260E74C8|nr:hypothetical protein [Persephonella sp.]
MVTVDFLYFEIYDLRKLSNNERELLISNLEEKQLYSEEIFSVSYVSPKYNFLTISFNDFVALDKLLSSFKFSQKGLRRFKLDLQIIDFFFEKDLIDRIAYLEIRDLTDKINFFVEEIEREYLHKVLKSYIKYPDEFPHNIVSLALRIKIENEIHILYYEGETFRFSNVENKKEEIIKLISENIDTFLEIKDD